MVAFAREERQTPNKGLLTDDAARYTRVPAPEAQGVRRPWKPPI
jgi:hypothetical protein